MNEYIKSLKNQGKLNISIDKEKTFNWEYTKIAGPCSVEGPEIVDIAKEIKSLGANAFRAGAYKPCTYPVLKETNGWKEGLREKGLRLLKQVKQGFYSDFHSLRPYKQYKTIIDDIINNL